MNIGIVCVLKDEADVLPYTIDTWKAMSDTIFYFDTGSTDETLRIISKNLRPGDVLSELPWKNFGDTVNEAMNLASKTKECDWLLRIDADERTKGDLDKLRDGLEFLEREVACQIGHVPSGLVSHWEINPTTGKWEILNWRARFFRWSDGWSYKYPIDPQPVPPPNVKDGVQVPPALLSVYHLRESTREEALRRNEAYVQKRMCDPHVPEDELDHYDTVLKICGYRGGEEWKDR